MFVCERRFGFGFRLFLCVCASLILFLGFSLYRFFVLLNIAISSSSLPLFPPSSLHPPPPPMTPAHPQEISLSQKIYIYIYIHTIINSPPPPKLPLKNPPFSSPPFHIHSTLRGVWLKGGRWIREEKKRKEKKRKRAQ